MKETKIALGTWAWGAGAFGGDAVFGSNTDIVNLKPVFDAAMKAGLNLFLAEKGLGNVKEAIGLGLDSLSHTTDVLERDTMLFPRFKRRSSHYISKRRTSYLINQ